MKTTILFWRIEASDKYGVHLEKDFLSNFDYNYGTDPCVLGETLGKSWGFNEEGCRWRVKKVRYSDGSVIPYIKALVIAEVRSALEYLKRKQESSGIAKVEEIGDEVVVVV